MAGKIWKPMLGYEKEYKVSKQGEIYSMRLGKCHTEKTKQKMRISHLGKNLSSDTKLKISQSHKGKKMSIESRQKMSNARKRWWRKNRKPSNR